MKKIDIDSAVQAAKQIKETTAALHARKAELHQQQEGLLKTVQAIYRLPLRKDEIKQIIFDQIDRQAGEFLGAANWTELVRGFLTPKGQRPSGAGPVEIEGARLSKSDNVISLQDIDAAGENGYAVVFGPARHANFFGGVGELAASDVRCTSFFFGDIIKKKIERHFDSIFAAATTHRGGGFDGPTIEEKRAQIAQQNKAIEELDQELERINGQLKALTEAGPPVDANSISPHLRHLDWRAPTTSTTNEGAGT